MVGTTGTTLEPDSRGAERVPIGESERRRSCGGARRLAISWGERGSPASQNGTAACAGAPSGPVEWRLTRRVGGIEGQSNFVMRNLLRPMRFAATPTERWRSATERSRETSRQFDPGSGSKTVGARVHIRDVARERVRVRVTRSPARRGSGPADPWVEGARRGERSAHLVRARAEVPFPRRRTRLPVRPRRRCGRCVRVRSGKCRTGFCIARYPRRMVPAGGFFPNAHLVACGKSGSTPAHSTHPTFPEQLSNKLVNRDAMRTTRSRAIGTDPASGRRLRTRVTGGTRRLRSGRLAPARRSKPVCVA